MAKRNWNNQKARRQRTKRRVTRDLPQWTGKIPWTLEGLEEACGFERRLRTTPKDDWDLTERSLTIATAEGAERLGFNPMMAENHVMFHVMRRHPGVEGMAHSFRYIQIMKFLHHNLDRLAAEGLVRGAAECLEFSRHLLKALCVLPYSERVMEKGDCVERFRLSEVLAKASEFEAEDRGCH
jgi:hypothetical protein